MKNLMKLIPLVLLLSTNAFAEKGGVSDTYTGNFQVFRVLDDAMTNSFDSWEKNTLSVSENSVIMNGVSLKCEDAKDLLNPDTLAKEHRLDLIAVSNGSYDYSKVINAIDCQASDGDKAMFIFQEINGLSNKYLRVIELGVDHYFLRRI